MRHASTRLSATLALILFGASGAAQAQSGDITFNGAVDAGAETARLGQQDVVDGHQSTPISSTSKVTGWPASGWLKSKRTAPSSRTSSTTPA